MKQAQRLHRNAAGGSVAKLLDPPDKVQFVFAPSFRDPSPFEVDGRLI
jgi:hypothetical protein